MIGNSSSRQQESGTGSIEGVDTLLRPKISKESNHLNVAIAECKFHPLAGQEAIVEAVMRAKELGFSKLIVLTNSKSTEKIERHEN